MYNHKQIENKWKQYWIKHNVYAIDINSNKQKYYVLDMFPYPSGTGLHVGHPKGYTPTDVVARFKSFNGFNVMHPIGWDAFGLPAEQYAISTGNQPDTFTLKNIDNFRKQIQDLGFSYDYNKEVNTTDPKYYRWTQWIFSKLFEHGLAEIKDVDVNWCEGLQTVLANEEILIENNKMVSERGSFPVVKKPMRQWILKITKYANKLLESLDDLDWPESLKSIQRNWIGRSQGTKVIFNSNNINLDVFTTRIDTLYGVTFLAIAPDHELLKQLITKDNLISVNNYIESSKSKSLLQRQEAKEKTGVFTGSYATNPINNQLVPIWVADYVIKDYAQGIVMGVADADERDFEFAKKYHLPIIQIMQGEKDICHPNDGKHINSNLVNGMNIEQAKKVINVLLIKQKKASIETNYKLKDWIFSRQRYWGEPFPIAFDQNNVAHLITDLPVVLPFTKNIKPTISGESPLANLTDWVNLTIDGKKYKRETNTMPQWAGSCWYYLAYLLKKDNGDYVDLNSKQAYSIFEKWLPVDLYVGGQEHAVLHLLYARFWHRFLFDIGVVPTKEPFYKLINQGMILGPNGEKMSKSKGNVINPSDIVESLGADSLRIYELFMGPLTATLPWSEQGLNGARKWLDKVYRFFTNDEITITKDLTKVNEQLIKSYHIFIKEVTDCINNFQFNVAISKMMVYINECYKHTIVYDKHNSGFLIVLSCFAPFIAEELYHMMQPDSDTITKQIWPTYDNKYLQEQNVTLPIQINGKLRDAININCNSTQEEVIILAKAQPKIIALIENKEIKKVIYVQNKILNIII